MLEETLKKVLDYYNANYETLDLYNITTDNRMRLASLFWESIVEFNKEIYIEKNILKGLDLLAISYIALILLELTSNIKSDTPSTRILWHLNNMLNYNQKIDINIWLELINELLEYKLNNKNLKELIDKYNII